MFYADSQRTVTRRDSSLIRSKSYPFEDRLENDLLCTARGQSATRLISDSGFTVGGRPKGSVQNEIITLLFESMLENIVESWEVIEQRKPEEIYAEVAKTSSELTLMSKKKKSVVKQAKTKRSRSKTELFDGTQTDSTQQSWWMSPDERAVIRFRNGNVYEGNVSMKCMHGEGRFQWANGTVYLGQFKNNEINGKGKIQWKDDTWYEGYFLGNLRHGRGLYVDSRKQCSYAGGWDCGTKHGEGVIYYTGLFNNSYDGEWINNVRHGFGSREYCSMSGFKGNWDKYIRDGKGLMIWPNHDFYRGEWKNGVMSGYGIYIWDAYYNNSMSSPSICAYHGSWKKGQRRGFGVINFGFGLGSYYKGEFRNNKKHGAGKLVTNNGLILQHSHLFVDDNIGTLTDSNENDDQLIQALEPFRFDICNDSVGLLNHIQQALNNIDRQQEIRDEIILDFFVNNKLLKNDCSFIHKKSKEEISEFNFEDLVEFEVRALYKALKCYETDLKNIYYQYATICNTEEIYFTPILIRLYLWQLCYDCNMHEKGLTMVEIDQLFYKNSEWLAKTLHNPFEKIYFWQFLHSLISIASYLYAKRCLPEKKPDTILASAFRFFMENDVLPGAGRKHGRLTNSYGTFVPLQGLYELYHSLGEPCTIRTFLRSINFASHDIYHTRPNIFKSDYRSLGRNTYIFGDELTFLGDVTPVNIELDKRNIKLFNFSNLPSKTVIKIFASIFPQVCANGKIMNLNIELTFFEFFEAFIACTAESIKLSDEQICKLDA